MRLGEFIREHRHRYSVRSRQKAGACLPLVGITRERIAVVAAFPLLSVAFGFVDTSVFTTALLPGFAVVDP